MHNIFGSSLIKGLSCFIKSKFNIKREMKHIDTERKLKNIAMSYEYYPRNQWLFSKKLPTQARTENDHVLLLSINKTKIRIWRTFMPTGQIYVINCIGSVEVPTDAKSSKENLRKLIDMFWFLNSIDCIYH
ncbi:hypothetical protein EDC94DRAFT_561559 [Helicostylum pulchrum]|nr:hypothetical protein EDC94DRAFT_561559 [Helicostylum pulchrum]